MTTTTLANRFWAKVQKGVGRDACWLWSGAISSAGYGNFWWAPTRVNMNAHRAAWLLTYGSIASDLVVCHNCPTGDNRLCVRPSHLFIGTTRDNVHDTRAKGRFPWTHRTQCSHGHSLSGANRKTFRRVAWPGLTFVTCRICAQKARMAHYYRGRGAT